MSTMSSASNVPSSRSGSSLYFSGAGSQRMSSYRALSVHGGAGGSNTRVSQSFMKQGLDSMNGLDNGFITSLDEKSTMKNLNDRLASYLSKVHALEKANTELERKIREWSEKKTLVSQDYSPYYATIADLRRKIQTAFLDNARVMLHIDNAKLASEDFRVKYENELTMRRSVEADVASLRRVVDELTMARSDLELRIEELREELVYLKKNHEEEMMALRQNMSSSSVSVDVDAKPQEDLAHVLDDIRLQYETIIQKKRGEMDTWYKAKFDELSKQTNQSKQVVQTSHSEINELKRTLQALEIELKSQLSLKEALEGTLHETESQYSIKLSQMQDIINNLQAEITQICSDIERHGNEYKILLDIKTRLEMEIAEYRRLLEGEDSRKTTVTKVVETKATPPPPPKHEPVITKRVRTVIEEVVDGKVVSRTEDVDTEVLSK